MWWDDDNNLKGDAVMRGAAPLDPLFLEAEKLGFDIRNQKPVGRETGVSMSATVSGADEKTMVFGFFDSNEGASSADAPQIEADVATPSPITDCGHLRQQQQQKQQKPPSILNRSISMEDIISQAKLFCRVR